MGRSEQKTKTGDDVLERRTNYHT